MDTFVLMAVLFPLATVSSLILPMTNPRGQPDMTSVISHVTLMEQTMSNVQSQMLAAVTELASVKTKLQTTESELSAVKTSLKVNDIELTTVKNKLTSVESELASTKTELSVVKSKSRPSNVPNATEITGLKMEMEELRLQQNKTGTIIDKLRSDLLTNGNVINSLNSSTQSLISTCTTDISFQVSLSNDTTNVYGNKFDTVDFNNGGGYSAETGAFIAPVSGFYIFWTQMSIEDTNGVHIETWIYRQGEIMALDSANSNERSRLTAMVVTNMVAGDQVYFYWSTTYTVKKASHYGGLLLTPK